MGVSWYIACVVYVYMCLTVCTLYQMRQISWDAHMYVCRYMSLVLKSSAPFQACRFRYDSFCVQGVNTWMSHVTEQFAIDTSEDHCRRRVIEPLFNTIYTVAFSGIMCAGCLVGISRRSSAVQMEA